MYAQQRYYDPVVGRFISIDPVGADPSDPRLFGRYHYGANNPYRYTDPNGEYAQVATRVGQIGLQALSRAAKYTTGALGAVVGLDAINKSLDEDRVTFTDGVPDVDGPVMEIRGEEWLDHDEDDEYHKPPKTRNRQSNDDERQKDERLTDRPKGTLPADIGSEVWGKRHGINKDKARKKFHDIKGDDGLSGADDDLSVDPDSGDVYDPAGDHIGNLND